MSRKYTGVTFGSKHSYTDWGLKLKSVKIGLPGAKTVTIEVDGMDGVLDLTEAQNGGVRYTNRTLEFVFEAVGVKYRVWTALLSSIAQEIHGKNMRINMDIDPAYYYYGRCELDTSKNNEITAGFTVRCNVGPYKTHIASDGGNWLWDPFRFHFDTIREPYSFTIDSENSWQEVSVRGYPHNISIKFNCSAAMKVKYDDVVYDLAAGESETDDFLLADGVNTLYFKGVGTVSVLPRGGML